jgi:hypothetical protein
VQGAWARRASRFAAALAWAGCASSGAPVGDAPSSDDTDHDHLAGRAGLPALCVASGPPPSFSADLVEWADAADASQSWFFGRTRLWALEAEGDPAEPDAARVDRLIERGYERLKFGGIDAALADLEAAVSLASSSVPERLAVARRHLVVAWLRKAEIDNCIGSGVGDACLVPFGDEAEHGAPAGMEGARAVATDVLEASPEPEYTMRWLLNVAHMALGTYPDGVDPRWLVPPDALAGEAEVPAWTNVAPALGLRTPDISGGVVAEDVSGDGLLDLLVSSIHPRQGMRLLLNVGDGTVCDASDASGVSSIPGVLQVVAADFDNDGDVDVMAPRGAWLEDDGRVRPSLLVNDGQGRFTDRSVEAGLAETVGPTQTAAWADVDGDGWVDLFVGRERHHQELGLQGFPSSLYMNQRDGTFVDVAEEAGLRVRGYVKGAAFGDLDLDGDPDLVVSIMGAKNRTYLNEGAGVFRDATETSGLTDPEMGFSIALLDPDQDGDLDVLGAAYPTQFTRVVPIDEGVYRTLDPWVADVLGDREPVDTMRLRRNDGGGVFVDATEAFGLNRVSFTMGSSVGDLNADGLPDLYLATGSSSLDALQPNLALLNVDGAAFADVTQPAHLGHLQKGHGVSFADLDEDGDEDLYVELGGAFANDAFANALFRNPTDPETGLILRLIGVRANRSAFGARVRAVFEDRVAHLTVGPGSSFGGNSLQVEVAVRDGEALDHLEVDWPWGATEIIEGARLGSVVTLREGDGVVDQRPLRRIPLGDEAGHAM